MHNAATMQAALSVVITIIRALDILLIMFADSCVKLREVVIATPATSSVTSILWPPRTVAVSTRSSSRDYAYYAGVLEVVEARCWSLVVTY